METGRSDIEAKLHGNDVSKEGEEGKLRVELTERILQIFADFMESVTKFEVVVSAGGGLLAGFRESIEFLRRPPISRTSKVVENIIKSNETTRLRSYFDAGCIKVDNGACHMTKLQTCLLEFQNHLCQAKSILRELESFLEDASTIVQTTNKTLLPLRDVDLPEEDLLYSCPLKPQITDYGAIMAVICSMIKRDYLMQERIVSSLNHKTSSEELESYSLMWSLRPFINDEIIHQARTLKP